MEMLLVLAHPFVGLQTTGLAKENDLLQLMIVAVIAVLGACCFGLILKIGGVDWLDAYRAGMTFSVIWFLGGIYTLLSAYAIAGLITLAGDHLLEAITATGIADTISMQTWLGLQNYGSLVIILVLTHYCTFGLFANLRKALK